MNFEVSTTDLWSWIRIPCESERHTEITQLETKASSHQGQCTPAGSSVSLPRRVLITIYVNNNHA